MEEVAYIGGKYKPLSKNKINDIILNGESLIKNKVVDLTNVIGSGGGNVDLSDYVTKTGEDTITVNTDDASGSGLIVQYGTDDSITNTTNITPSGIVTSYKSGKTNYNATYSITGMQLSTGSNAALFGASALQYSIGDKQGSINYADILTSADLSNYAKLDANNTFTGNNTFNSNLISQVLDMETISTDEYGYKCLITVDTVSVSMLANPTNISLSYVKSDDTNYINSLTCTNDNDKYNLTLIYSANGTDSARRLNINPDGITFKKGNKDFIKLGLDETFDTHYLAIYDNNGKEGVTFLCNSIEICNEQRYLNYSDIATKVTTTESSDTAITLKPNTNVDITPTAATAITIAKPTDTTMVNIYSCTVNTKTSSEVTIALADTEATITWDDTPSFEAGKLYEISVRYTPSGYFGLIHSWSL